MSINTKIHYPLIKHAIIKEKKIEVKGTHKKSFSLIDLSIGGGLANATPACYSSTLFILQVSSNRDDPNHSFIHPLQRGAQLLIFCIISLASFVGNANHLSQWQWVPRSTKWSHKLHNCQKLCNSNKSRPF